MYIKAIALLPSVLSDSDPQQQSPDTPSAKLMLGVEELHDTLLLSCRPASIVLSPGYKVQSLKRMLAG